MIDRDLEQDFALREGSGSLPDENTIQNALLHSRILMSKSATCGMFKTKLEVSTGADGSGKKTYDIMLDETGTMVLLHKMAVNLDGSPRAYHPADPYGTCTNPDNNAEVCAINALCNGGIHIADKTGKRISCSRKVDDYKKAWAALWKKVSSATLKPKPVDYWKVNRDEGKEVVYGYYDPESGHTLTFKKDIIPHGGDQSPCVRDVSAATYNGYFVSSTALKGDEGEDELEGQDWSKIVRKKLCSPIKDVDAETARAVVVPVKGFRDAVPGDIIVAMMERPGHKAILVKGVVGDTGPDLGEATPAFIMALAGAKKAPLKKYTEALKLHLEDGKNIKIAMLVLPGSKKRLNKPGSTELLLSQKNVARKSEEAFAEWGGGAVDLAEKKFRACFSALKAPGTEGLVTE